MMKNLLPLALVTGVLFFLLHIVPVLTWKKMHARDARWNDDFSAEISDDGIHLRGSTGEGTTRWSGFTRFLESGNVFVLYLSSNIFHVIPKRYFETSDLEQFRALLDRNLSAGRR